MPKCKEESQNSKTRSNKGTQELEKKELPMAKDGAIGMKEINKILLNYNLK